MNGITLIHMKELQNKVKEELESLKTYLEENEDSINQRHKEFVESQIELKESYIN